MLFSRKIVVAVDLSGDLSEILSPVRQMDFLKHAEIHFVHVFNTINYSFMFGDFPLVYPIEADKKMIEDGILKLLSNKAKEILPTDFDGKMMSRCLFADNTKGRFCEYVDEEKPELVIIGTRVKHGFFESSFAQYVARHSKANLLLLKQRG